MQIWEEKGEKRHKIAYMEEIMDKKMKKNNQKRIYSRFYDHFEQKHLLPRPAPSQQDILSRASHPTPPNQAKL